jgi:hypothetical protein
MAATRPVVLVYQEFATLSSSPATPELNCLIAGPAYWIQDFPEDSAKIQIANYGITPGAVASGAAIANSAVVVANAPNNKVGAILDQASVRVFTRKTQVELAAAGNMTTTVGSPVVGAATTDFVAAGVKANDTIVMTGGATTLSRSVVSVTTNTLTLNSETPSGFSATNVKFRVERALSDSEIAASFYTFIPPTNSIQVNAGATLTVGASQKPIVSCELYVAYRSMRQDLADVFTLSSVTEVTGQLGRIDARNPLAVGVSVALQNTNTSVQYFGVTTQDITGYTSMKNSIGGRKDIYAVVPLIQDPLVLAMLKAEFVALADTTYAITNGIPQKFRVAIGSSTALPPTKIVIDVNTDGGTEVYAAMTPPTATHTLSLPAINLVTNGVLPGDQLTLTLDPATVQATGVLTATGNATPGDTVTVGTKVYTFVSPLVNVNGNVLIGATASDSLDNLIAAINLAAGAGTTYALSTSVNGVFTAVAGAGDTMDATAVAIGALGNGLALTAVSGTLSWGSALSAGGHTARNGVYVITQVLSETDLELKTALPGGVQAATNLTAAVSIGATVAARIAATPVVSALTKLDAQLFLDLYDPNGTFVDVGVMAGDLVEMPQNPNQSSFTTKNSFVVASIVSNQRLRIVDNGRSTELVAHELPHGASRNAPVTLIPATNTLYYRITRTLDKTGQVSELVAVTQSMASRRVVNVWPDLCDVGGLVDGSLPRNPLAPTTAQPAATQPGYYLACAVGGMTAGLPSHQGFTNLGIAGISKIYNSNTYFSDKQITDISNGGWFVFQQDTPQALPYVVHQLTTDVATLQSGEFSMVKNFDFVSIFFSDIVEEYIGIWNINPETLGFISASVVGGIDNLKLRRRPRIGAPIIGGTITSVSVSSSSADRVEMFVEIQFPAPLNTVGLHLVSA